MRELEVFVEPKMKTGLSIVVLFCVVVAGSCSAETPSNFNELRIGEPAPDFSLPGIDGRHWSLSDFADADLLVVYFTSNHCPICHAHDPRLMTLVESLADKNVKFVAINPNSGEGLRLDELGYSKYDDSFEDMKPYAQEQGFTFPYLYDGQSQTTAKAYGCLATPHMFIFDAERRLRYKGRLDDSRFADPATVKQHNARDAIHALMADEPVAVAVTKPFGCSTKWQEKVPEVKQADQRWKMQPVTLDEIDAEGVAGLVRNETGKYRLFNVWSTTCAPCVAEFPGLARVSRRMATRNFELITITTDLAEDRERVIQFLQRFHVVLPPRLAVSLKAEGRASNNYLYTGASIDSLIEALDPQWQGPQPHTVFIAPGGEVMFRHNGMISEEHLLTKILEAMGHTYLPN